MILAKCFLHNICLDDDFYYNVQQILERGRKRNNCFLGIFLLIFIIVPFIIINIFRKTFFKEDIFVSMYYSIIPTLILWCYLYYFLNIVEEKNRKIMWREYERNIAPYIKQILSSELINPDYIFIEYDIRTIENYPNIYGIWDDDYKPYHYDRLEK